MTTPGTRRSDVERPSVVQQEIQAMSVHIPEWPQAQYATADQLRVLMFVANRLGLYDAADWLRTNGVRR